MFWKRLSSVVFAALISVGIGLVNHADACGFKLQVKSESTNLLLAKRKRSSKSRVGSVLVYRRPVSTRITRALKRVGHKVETVDTQGELEKAMKSKKFDVVIISNDDAKGMTAESSAIIVPVLGPGESSEGHEFSLRRTSRALRRSLRVIDKALAKVAGRRPTT